MGYAAVLALLEGRRDEMVGIINREIAYTPFEKAIKHHKDIKRELLEMARILAT